MYQSKSISIQRIVVLDILAVVLMYMVPTISHLVRVPLYQFEPMRCVLFLNLLLLGDKRNAYIMAATLPLFSYAVGSHPVFIKAIVLTMELITNVYLFGQLAKKMNTGFAMFLSILASKTMYYVTKYVCISTGLLGISLVNTNIVTQLAVAVVLSLGFYKFASRK